jgi:phosphatidylserine/phosphatidylglycerophosphate/cardiolipin synthase-like enzyme
MVTFLKTSGITHEIEELISNAKQKLYLITPYLQISPLIRPLIRDLVLKIPTIDIIVVCRSDKINAEDMEFLQNLKSVKIWALDNLHAKCYLNEDTAILSSMNLYQYSERNNYEMGVKIQKNSADEAVYRELTEYIDILLRESVKYEIKRVEKESHPSSIKEVQKKPKESIPLEKTNSTKYGFCIRCHVSMDLNPDKPLCSKCYPIWAKYSDPTYPEKYCHICGKESKQSVEKPVCYNCYKKFYK